MMMIKTFRRFLPLAGILGGLLWIWLGLVPPEFGFPGSTAYIGYELWNRLWTPALVGMALGFYGFFRNYPALPKSAFKAGRAFLVGFIMMILGNISEFWIFTNQPYAAGFNMRNLSWITFLLGLLVMIMAAAAFGLSIERNKSFPKWLPYTFIWTFALTLIFFFIEPGWGFMIVGFLCVAVSWLGLHQARSGKPNVE